MATSNHQRERATSYLPNGATYHHTRAPTSTSMEQSTPPPSKRTQARPRRTASSHPNERVSARRKIDLAGLYRRCGPRQSSKGDEGNDKGCGQKEQHRQRKRI
mmetsp:Transcript_2866/g.5230  ORF Transcript_2866/g.5230 Transcript_2866/m.5230 type:complete len:103 (-) Transcript_2866:436-744(-)